MARKEGKKECESKRFIESSQDICEDPTEQINRFFHRRLLHTDYLCNLL